MGFDPAKAGKFALIKCSNPRVFRGVAVRDNQGQQQEGGNLGGIEVWIGYK
jgi:hypothetical protein